MFATKTAKTAPAAAEVRNAQTPAAAPADLAHQLLALYRAANPTPAAAPRPRAATNRPVGEKAACACGRFAVADGTETGCTATTWRIFAPGHDAKLKGLLQRAGAADQLVADAATGKTQTAQATAELFGFGDLVAEGIAKLRNKAAAKKAPKAKAAKVASLAEAAAKSDAEEAARKEAEAEANRQRLAEADAEFADYNEAANTIAAERAALAEAKAEIEGADPEDLFAALLAEAVAETEKADQLVAKAEVAAKPARRTRRK